MDSEANKLNDKLKVCQHKENCSSRNRRHFEAYSHPHLDKLYEQGRDATTNEYVVPDELSSLAEVLKIQLKLMQTASQESSQNNLSNQVNSNQEEAITGGTATSSSHSISSDSKDLNEDSTSSSETDELDYHDVVPVEHEPGKMLEKLKQAWPYNIFLNAIKSSKPTHNEPLSVTFQELFDESLGEIESTVQITYQVDFDWLQMSYKLAGLNDTPLLVVYGSDDTIDGSSARNTPQLTAFQVEMPSEFGIPHSKISIIGYKDGSMRLIVSTADLTFRDWKNRTQALWISPKLKKMPLNSAKEDGESPTEFRSDFMSLLIQYKCIHLRPWIARILRTDFSEINVFLIASAPGVHRAGWRGLRYGHPRLGNILQDHCAPINEKIPVVCQSSAVGSFGPDIESWIQHNFLSSVGKDTEHTIVQEYPPFNFIFPSFANVCNGHNGIEGGGWMPYEKIVNDQQLWLSTYLYQWRSNVRHRTGAMPHMKSYARFDLEEKCVSWFLLTSANLSKSAWGTLNLKYQNTVRMSNYEAGVLFVPKFVTGEQTFPLGCTRDGVPPFPLPYDVPLTPYEPDDKIYTKEDAYEYFENLIYMLS